MRRKFVAGNWKMHLRHESAVTLVDAIVASLPKSANVDVGVFPPFCYLRAVAEKASGSALRVGAQNCYVQADGAFTGEVSPAMIRDCGGEWVILGHSERRHVLGESDALVNEKVHAAIAHDLHVILCVGEKLPEREAGQTDVVLERQVLAGLAGIDAAQLKRIVIAYEPVWAIGTGKTATPQQAQEAHAFIRGLLSRKYGEAAAADVVIQYGGSVKPENAADLLSQADVDGALVGGASLKADSFLAIVTAAVQVSGG